MNLLHDYSSDAEEGDSGEGGACGEGVACSAQAAPPSAPAKKRRVVAISRLPVSRPPPPASTLASGAEAVDEAPELDLSAPLLRRAAAPTAPCSVASLPEPRVGEDSSEEGVHIDFRAAGRPQQRPQAEHAATWWLVRAPAAPEVAEEPAAAVPANWRRHPIFQGADGPSRDESEHLLGLSGVRHVEADQLRDPNWHMSGQITGGPGLHAGKRVPTELSMYDAESWSQTTHANPSRTEKRKHQLNWLAHDAIQHEAELLDRLASGRAEKAQTWRKYGW